MKTLNQIASICLLLFVCALTCECFDLWKMPAGSYYSLQHCKTKCCCGDKKCEPTSYRGMIYYKCITGCSLPLESPPKGDVTISGSRVGTRCKVGATATYSCDQGYTLVGGTNTRQCKADGTWSGSAPDCDPVVCPVPSNPVNGDYSLSDGRNFESKAEFTCDENYSLDGLSQLVCMSNGNWSGPSPTCTLTGCIAPLTSPIKGDVRISGSLLGLSESLRYEFGSTATYSCDQGYKLVGGTNPRHCEDTSSWSGDAPTCDPIICQDISNPDNGEVTLSMGINFESRAEFTCDETYNLKGLQQLVCMSNGYWSGPPPTCTRTTCGSLSAPANGTVNFSNGDLVGSIATFTCDEDLTMTGLSQIFCMSNGNWSGAAPTCTLVECGNLLSPTDGSYYLSNGNLVESIATFTCDIGNVMTGLSQIVCLSSGDWSESAPTCSLVDCGPLHANCLGLNMNITGTSYDSLATFDCDDDFILIGPNIRMCLANGSWSSDMPYCRPANCPEEFQETDYPIRAEDGMSWRPFWWYNSTGGWPADEDDTLGRPFGCCDPAATYCFGRMPQYLMEDQSELLAVDSAGNVYRWAFDSNNPTAHAVWIAFHDHIQTGYETIRNNAEWAPTIIAGGPYGKVRDSWMYRWEHGVGSFQLDDDNCECDSLLSAGHAMCHSGFLLPNNNPSGIEDQFGVGLMNENVCTPAATSPNPSNSLYMYYKVAP